MNTFGRSTGRSGNYSTNYQLHGRELLTADEVRMLDNSQALLFVRGERPMQDMKFDIKRHPNIRLTTDGGLLAYEHGKDTRSVASVALQPHPAHRYDISDMPEQDSSYIVLSPEEVESGF